MKNTETKTVKTAEQKAYMDNFMKATERAARIKGVSGHDVRANYRNFAAAPKELKGALLLAYKIMRNYKAAGTKAAEAAVEPAVEQ